MIGAGRLRFADEIESEAEAPVEPEAAGPEPQVFVRTVAAPPGWPWEQRRNVELEARYGAPLPISDLLYRLRRLEAWRPGAGSRFAIFYVLASDVRGSLEASAEVDGRTLSVSFGGSSAAGALAGRTLWKGLVAAAVLAVCVWSGMTALERRAEAAATLELAEQRAAAALRRAEARDSIREQGRLLDLQLSRGAPLADVLGDLAWASNAKAPEAQVEGVHWDRGLLAVEARGEASPFPGAGDRTVERSRAPVRRGVWLWGVTPVPPQGNGP